MGRKRKYTNAADRQRAYRQRQGRVKRNGEALQNPAEAIHIPTPPLRYHGGKWRLATWIIEQFPPHVCYVEPFCGGASVLFRKPPSVIEVINDLSLDIVTFFDVLRTNPEGLIRAIELTPHSREIHRLAYQPTPDPLEKALRFYIRCWQSFGTGEGKFTGWRFQRDNQRGALIVDDWNRTEQLWAAARRLKGVSIEHDNALTVIRRYDTPKTLFYVDPPYVLETRYTTRRGDKGYQHEMTDADHRALAQILHTVQGMVILSGYDCPLYQELYPGWKRLEKPTTTNGNGYAIESLWLSPRTLELGRLPLFEGVGE